MARKNMFGREMTGERAGADFYPTPDNVAEAQIRLTVAGSLTTDISWHAPRILDPAAGDGVYGRIARKLMPNAYIVGIEPRHDAVVEPAYDRLIRADFLTWESDEPPFRFAMTNPPYGMNQNNEKVENLVGKFYGKMLSLVDDPLGMVSLLVRTGFMHGVKRYNQFFAPGKDGRPRHVYGLVHRLDFTGESGFQHDEIIVVTPKAGALLTNYHWLKLDKQLPMGVDKKKKKKGKRK